MRPLGALIILIVVHLVEPNIKRRTSICRLPVLSICLFNLARFVRLSARVGSSRDPLLQVAASSRAIALKSRSAEPRSALIELAGLHFWPSTSDVAIRTGESSINQAPSGSRQSRNHSRKMNDRRATIASSLRPQQVPFCWLLGRTNSRRRAESRERGKLSHVQERIQRESNAYTIM